MIFTICICTEMSLGSDCDVRVFIAEDCFLPYPHQSYSTLLRILCLYSVVKHHGFYCWGGTVVLSGIGVYEN